MKQKKYGNKIQNWHRPLGPSQLRQRFFQMRHSDPTLTTSGKNVVDSVDLDHHWDYDNCWDFLNPRQNYPGCDNQLFHFHIEHLWNVIQTFLSPQIDLQWPRGEQTNEMAGSIAASVTEDHFSNLDFDEHLAEYIDGLVRLSSTDSLAFRYYITRAIGSPRNLEIIESEYSQQIEAAKRICVFAPFWKRRPDTWKKDSGTSLLDHLFVLYDVPKFLYSGWAEDLPGDHTYYYDAENIEGQMPRTKWLCWFILLGQGGSLKKAAEQFDWRIPGKYQHYLQEAPLDTSPVEACLFAEVKRLGGAEIDFRRICQNPAFVFDPTEMATVSSYRRFWQETVRWLITNRNAITDQESTLILVWAMHEHTEAERLPERSFSWRGRTVRAVLTQSARYNRQTSGTGVDLSWASHGWDWVREEKRPDQKWSFTELTSSKELACEGHALNHCVGGYTGLCVSGGSAIVSLKHNDKPLMTIEINPKTKQVVQARGAYNRPAKPNEKRLINQWVDTVVQP
jgi:hypothetical protein